MRASAWNKQLQITLLIVASLAASITCVSIYQSHFNVDPHHLIKTVNHQRKYWPTVIAAAMAVALVLFRPRLIGKHKVDRGDRDLITVHAGENLRRIRFMQTQTMEQSGAIGLPMRLQLGGRRTRQIVERDLTMPQIVSDYRAFMVEVVTWWRSKHGGLGRVIIGIDEVDKIGDIGAAERFLNEVKSIFGTAYCLYLVSISEEALMQFENRSVGFRSTFDSVFDDVVRVESISLVDAREVLLRRIAGIGDAFIALCYVISGGLPRDVLRIARAFVQARREGKVTLEEILSFLVQREVFVAKRKASRERAAKAENENISPIGDSLFDDEWPGLTSTQLLSSTSMALRENAFELYVALVLLGTIVEVFTDTIRSIDPMTFFTPGGHRDGIMKLATARSLLYSDSNAALELVHIGRRKLGLYALQPEL